MILIMTLTLAFPPSPSRRTRSAECAALFRPTLVAAAVLSTLVTLPAMAQTTATPVVIRKKVEPPAPAPEAGIETTVTVTANRPTNRIDRQVYDVKSDVNSTNGSAADALNNVPSVAVDPDGTVTLRGSTNVQILIDGKPSAMLQGDNRGATLNALAADDIESVEVINNPGAQFGNEAGGGPILNLVMRRTRRPGGFGSVNANIGSGGRYNTALSGSYNEGRFGVQGGVNVRHDGRDSFGESDRTRIDPLTGAASRSTQQSRSEGLNDSRGFNYALTYNLGDKDTIVGSIVYALRSNDQLSSDHYVRYNSDASLHSDYTRLTNRGGSSENFSWGGRYDHKGDVSGELARLDLRVSTSTNESENAYVNAYAVRPAGVLDVQSVQANRSENRIADLTGDYERPVEMAFLKLGFKVASNVNEFDTAYASIDPFTGARTANPVRSNRFALDETNLALYGSYQMRLNERWGLLAGVRTEYTKMKIAQLTSGVGASNDYINVIPSLFATYKISDDSSMRLSYAHRIRRPNANDLNPFVIYRDEFNVSSGNPNLKPTKTDSLELGYESRFWVLDTNLRGYFRKDSGLISERKTFISDTVILTTRDNAGSNRAGGLEFTLSGKVLPKVSLNASGNLAYTEQRIFGSNVTSDAVRDAVSLSGRARLNYQMSAADQIQLTLNMQGKTLSGQGYRQPNSTANYSWRHTLTPALNLVFNVTDVFNSNRSETITDAEFLKETSLRRSTGRVIYLGLSYRIGGAGQERGQERGQGGGQGRRPQMRLRGDGNPPQG
jgi:outer membrane receptor protein involved in Fe transport